MTIIFHGKVHGKTVELREDLGLTEGQEVEISVRTVGSREPGAGLLRTEGAPADDLYWEAIVDELHRERQNLGPSQRRKTSRGRSGV